MEPHHTAPIRFEPIEYINLTDRVYRAIKDRILSQEIEVGSRLRDEELAVQLGVSRTPVREAIMRLAQEGLVAVIPRSGTQVRTFAERDIEEIWDLRVVLEALAARKAVRHITVEQLKRLRAMHEKSESGMKSGNTKLALQFDQEMHRVILQASGSRRLQDIMATINDFVELLRNIGARTPFHRGYTYRHSEILRALERRDADAAGRAIAEHIEMSKQELFRDFQQRKLQKLAPADRVRPRPGRRHEADTSKPESAKTDNRRDI
jgi:DNA-binding GntR family transcriptional regulator